MKHEPSYEERVAERRPPSCEDCKHFSAGYAFGTRMTVLDECRAIFAMPPATVRGSDAHCGISGRYWEPRPEPPVPSRWWHRLFGRRG